MYIMTEYNFENCLENDSAPLCRNSAKVLALEDVSRVFLVFVKFAFFYEIDSMEH